MFIKTIILMTATIAVLIGGSHAADLSGRLTDAQTGEPIAGATVKIKGSNIGTIADGDGRYRFTDLAPEEFILVVTVIGYNVAYNRVDPQQTETADFSLTPKILKGQDIIVTATRARQGETPVAFTNISNSDIKEKYFAQDIPMLLGDTPNVFAYSESGNGIGNSYMRIRGFDQKRIAVMLNGVPLNDAESGEVFWIDLPDFAESVEDIQIQRGVGNSLYGAAAMGGSVNLITTAFSINPRFKIKTGYGSYNTKKLLLSGNSGLIGDSYGLSWRLSRIETDGYRDKSWSRMWGYFIGLSRFDEKSTLRLNFYGGPEESHLAYKGITKEQLEEYRRYNELQFQDETDHFHQPHYELIHDIELNERTSLSNTLYYFEGIGYYTQFRSRRYIEEYNLGEVWVSSPDEYPSNYYADVDDSTGLPIVDPATGLYELERADIIRRRTVKENDWGWIPRLSLDIDRGMLIAGGEIRLHKGHHYGSVPWASIQGPGVPTNPRYYDYFGSRQSYTVFGHLGYDLTDRLSTMMDLQYQRYRYELSDDKRFDVKFERTYDFVAPRFGLNYRINNRVSIFGNVSTASRQPAFKDIYDPTDYWSNPDYKSENFDQVNGGYNFVGKELKPEKLFDIETGGDYRKSFSGNDLDLKLNLYRMQITDEIIPYAGQIDDNNYPISGNADKTLHQGIEISAKLKTEAKLAFYGNLSVNDDHFEEYTEYDFDWIAWEPIELDQSGNRIGGFPSMLANYGVTYRYRELSFGLYGRFVGEQYLDNSEDDTKKLESYHVVDLAVSLDLGNELGLASAILNLRINNLFDTEYSSAGYIEEDDNLPRYIVGAETNYFVSLEMGL